MPLVDTVTNHKVDYTCAGCGYGIAIATPPSVCPMCHGSEWDRPLWRPFTSLEEYQTRFEPLESEELLSAEALVL